MTVTSEKTNLNNSKRLGNMDLLRTACAIFVVYDHLFGAVKGNVILSSCSFISQAFLNYLYSVTIVAVPTFFIISGYFSVNSKKQKLGKVIGLYIMTVAYSIFENAAFSVKSLLSGDFAFPKISLLAKNYYFYLFAGVYLLSPFINSYVQQISKHQYRRLLITLVSLFVVWSTLLNTYGSVTGKDSMTSVFFTSRTGTSNGFNIVNMITLYLIGGYIKLHLNIENNAKKVRNYAALCFISLTVLSTVVTMIFKKTASAFYCYDNIFVVASSISLFLFFLTLSVKSNRFITLTGKYTYGTFLIHGFANAAVTLVISREKVLAYNYIGTLLFILIFVFVVYLLALAITVALQFIAKPINKVFKETKLYNYLLFTE